MSAFFNTTFVIVIMIFLFSNSKTSGHAADFYKYLDQNGTLVFTEDLSTIPAELRDKVGKITMPGDTSDARDEPQILKNFTDTEQIKKTGKKQLRKGRVALKSFLEDEKVLLGGYAITGIILFLFLSKMFGNLGANLLKKIIFKIVFVTALFCGAYFWYLSYLNKNVLNFDPSGTGGKGASSKLTTPAEMLKKTKDIIDQVNTRTEKKQKLLDSLE